MKSCCPKIRFNRPAYGEIGLIGLSSSVTYPNLYFWLLYLSMLCFSIVDNIPIISLKYSNCSFTFFSNSSFDILYLMSNSLITSFKNLFLILSSSVKILSHLSSNLSVTLIQFFCKLHKILESSVFKSFATSLSKTHLFSLRT